MRAISRLGLLASLLMAWTSPANAWWNHEWSYRKPITLNPQAAGVTGDLTNTVVLVRLHDGVLNFSDANPDGSDLRFIAGDDKTPLAFHIERFDSVFNLAFAWVQIPALKGPAPAQIWLYYGNAHATAGAKTADTYDANQTLVYHFAEKSGPPSDATAFSNNAASAFPPDDSGLIGGAARFSGTNAIALPSSASLSIAAGSAFTWSAWIKPMASDADRVIYAQHDGAHALIIAQDKGAPYFAIAGDAGLQRSSTAAALTADAWHHLALIATTTPTPVITLFIDGVPGPTLPLAMPALASAGNLGADVAVAGATPAPGFQGEIDELELSKVARDAAFIKLAAGNQGTDDKLVSFGADEQQSSWSTGYFGIIMKSVTVDGWVVIGLLSIMAVVSWWVMFSKGRETGRVNRANDTFTEQFRTIRDDVTNLENTQKIADREREQMLESSLFRMYEVGRKEILHRFQVQGHAKALSAESIESIRAAVDASLVRENQKISKNIVLLTIAISGAPFLGLLGTVVGVMITFAAIAAAGDVNVNAIAPGISAALLATVAGMAVAIPALFGYNYLLTRIKDIQANMTVFVDEFVTRMAEMYPASSYNHLPNLRQH